MRRQVTEPRWVWETLRGLIIGLLVLLAMSPTPGVQAAPPAQENDCGAFLEEQEEEERELGFQRREQDVFPTRTTGVAHFYNFTEKEYTLRIADHWQSLHAGSRFQPYEIWIELPPGEYEYYGYYDGGVIQGSTYVFETLTWPAAFGVPYQEPPPPQPVGPYEPPLSRLSTLVFRNSSTFEVTLTVYGESHLPVSGSDTPRAGYNESYVVHARNAEDSPGELILFVPPGDVDYALHLELPVSRSQAAAAGCEEEYDRAEKLGLLRTKTVRLGQVALVEFPK